jgi:hypothetical protein
MCLYIYTLYIYIDELMRVEMEEFEKRRTENEKLANSHKNKDDNAEYEKQLLEAKLNDEERERLLQVELSQLMEVHIYMCIYVYIYIFVYIYVYVYIYIYVYICIYI